MKLHFCVPSIFGSFFLTFLAFKEIEGGQTIGAKIHYSGSSGDESWPGSSTEPKKITVNCDSEKMDKIAVALKDRSGKWKIIWTNPQTTKEIEEEIFDPAALGAAEGSEGQLKTLTIKFIQMVGLSHANSTPRMYGEVVDGYGHKELENNRILFKGREGIMKFLWEDLKKHDVWQCLPKMPILPENATILSPIIHNVVNRLDDDGAPTDVFSLTVEIPASIKLEITTKGNFVEGVVLLDKKQIKLYVKPSERKGYKTVMKNDVKWSGEIYLKYPFNAVSYSVLVVNPKVSKDVKTVASELKGYEVLTVNYEKLDFQD